MDPTKPILGMTIIIQIYTQTQDTPRTVTTTAATATHIRSIVITRPQVPVPNITVLHPKKKYHTANSRYAKDNTGKIPGTLPGL